ncbi:hypothetical protein B0H14DRAFT_954816 [Mycena olivaceomarginata]|nr:hypothetical protein B0H14DRAFT_954816 [Mycena olivaceomarginata]
MVEHFTFAAIFPRSAPQMTPSSILAACAPLPTTKRVISRNFEQFGWWQIPSRTPVDSECAEIITADSIHVIWSWSLRETFLSRPVALAQRRQRLWCVVLASNTTQMYQLACHSATSMMHFLIAGKLRASARTSNPNETKTVSDDSRATSEKLRTDGRNYRAPQNGKQSFGHDFSGPLFGRVEKDFAQVQFWPVFLLRVDPAHHLTARRK